MRLFVGVILLITTFSAFSQDIEFPPNCGERLLTPTAGALCTDLREVSLLADAQYLKALSKTDSLNKWYELEVIRLKFISKFYECRITGSARALSDCLKPTYQVTLDNLKPLSDDSEVPYETLQLQARQASEVIEARAYEQFKKCALERIAVLDDGISPARDIAQGVGNACRSQALSWATVRYAILSVALICPVTAPSAKLALVEKIIAPDSLVETVLEYRASKRLKQQPQPQQPPPQKKTPISRKMDS